jgi:Na+/H+-translocating membrane pyrophosphatase
MMDLFAKGIDDNIGTVEDSVENVSRSVAGSFSADVGYNLPDIAGYAADLSATMTANATTEIIVPLSIDGREIARASAWYMNEQLAWEAR